MRIDAEMLAGMLGAQEELDRQVAEGELFYREEDSYVDGRIDLAALVCAVLEHGARGREPVVFDYVANSGTTYRCTVNGPTNIVVERLLAPAASEPTNDAEADLKPVGEQGADA